VIKSSSTPFFIHYRGRSGRRGGGGIQVRMVDGVVGEMAVIVIRRIIVEEVLDIFCHCD